MWNRSVYKKSFNSAVVVQVTIFLCIITMSSCTRNVTETIIDSYLKQREELLQNELRTFSSNKTPLTQTEEKVNSVILNAKIKELSSSYENSTHFLPSRPFQEAKRLIKQSNVFKILRKLPKGASLHTHLLAGVSVDFIIHNLTYREDLYGAVNDNGVFKLKFFKEGIPTNKTNIWKPLKEYREENSQFDVWLRSILVLKKSHNYDSVENVWSDFKKIFTTLYDMLAYKPVFKDYVYQLLQELYDDNVFYTELRGTFMPLYDLEQAYGTEDFFTTFVGVVDEFKADHPGFVGAKYIHSIYRGVEKEELRKGLNELIFYKRMFPDFIAGFDFVGYEEDGKQLLEFKEELVEARKHLDFFFHAGETNWFGHTDVNLVDAILLNSSRIGHAFSLPKHPVLIDLILEKNIAIEVSPISNQVLWLIKDLRNHPGAVLLSKNLPVVICNDDPSIWEAEGLSFDWYMVFMALTWKNHGLEVLKELAINTIKYSAMNASEKKVAMSQWEKNWLRFLEIILEDYNANNSLKNR